MCPLCDKFCDFWKLDGFCFHAKFTYLVDNPSTIFFTAFMSLWGKSVVPFSHHACGFTFKVRTEIDFLNEGSQMGILYTISKKIYHHQYTNNTVRSQTPKHCAHNVQANSPFHVFCSGSLPRDVETVFCRNHPSMGFDRFWHSGRAPKTSVPGQISTHKEKNSQHCHKNCGAKTPFLENEVPWNHDQFVIGCLAGACFQMFMLWRQIGIFFPVISWWNWYSPSAWYTNKGKRWCLAVCFSFFVVEIFQNSKKESITITGLQTIYYFNVESKHVSFL